MIDVGESSRQPERRRRVFVAALASVLVLLPASRTVAIDCFPGKSRCIGNAVKSLLRCHVTAEKKGAAISAPAQVECLQRARGKFDGGALVPPEPARGCFEKLEARQDPGDPAQVCATEDDTAAQGAKIEAFVEDVVQRLDPAYPAPVLNECAAAKKRCVLDRTVAIIKCHTKAVQGGSHGVDPACAQKARDRYDGGLDPSRGCFARAETRFGAACLTSGDSEALEVAVDELVYDALCELAYPTVGCQPPTPVPGPCARQTDGTCGGDCGFPNSLCVSMVGGFCGCLPATRTPTPTPTPTQPPTWTPVPGPCARQTDGSCNGDCGSGYSICVDMGLFGGLCGCEPPTPPPGGIPTPGQVTPTPTPSPSP
jgi:hypothetical protein